MTGLTIQGADDFERLARRLRAAEVERAVTVGFEDEAAATLEKMRRGGVEVAPRRGGLAARIAGVRATSRRAFARMRLDLIIASLRGDDLASFDEGRVHHPTYGHRPWVSQDVTPGGFTGPFTRSEPDLQAALRRRLEGVLHDIGG